MHQFSPTHQMPWRKAKRSAEGNDACVEIARTDHGIIVRDSKNPDGPLLHINQAAWQTLAHRIKRDRAALPPA